MDAGRCVNRIGCGTVHVFEYMLSIAIAYVFLGRDWRGKCVGCDGSLDRQILRPGCRLMHGS